MEMSGFMSTPRTEVSSSSLQDLFLSKLFSDEDLQGTIMTATMKRQSVVWKSWMSQLRWIGMTLEDGVSVLKDVSWLR